MYRLQKKQVLLLSVILALSPVSFPSPPFPFLPQYILSSNAFFFSFFVKQLCIIFIGIRVGFSLPLRSIVNCIARQDETNEFSQWLNVHSLLSPNSGLTTKSDFNQRHKHADSFHSSERKQDIVQNMISSDRAIIELLKSRIGSKIAWW